MHSRGQVEGRVGSVDSRGVPDVSCRETWQTLQSDKESVLIDVRTRSEWAFVGLPDLSGIGKQVVTIEWQTFPDNRLDPDFVDRLANYLEANGVSKSDPLFFICRSGSRSRMAAEAMAAAGYATCANVAEGFEGPLDAERHRGTVSGWKKSGLPWVQG